MKKSEIALVRPNYRSHLITPPLGLGYLSSYLKNEGYKTRIIDGLNLNHSVDYIINQCDGVDIVGISCMSAYFLETAELSNRLKANGFTVVVGGPHASALPELTLGKTRADYIIIGEGELSLSQLVDKIEDNEPTENIPGIMCKNSKGVVARRPLIEDLDSLPFPDWEGIDPRTYAKAPHGGLVKSFPVAPIISTRGCPFECAFCASPFLWEQRIRFRSPENVVDEIEYLVKAFKVKEIHFEDDNLTLKRTHIEDICRLILKRKIKIDWAAPNGVRVDTLDTELLKLMKTSGCYFIAFGIESGNQKILDCVKKKIDLDMIEKAVTLSKKAGLITQGFFIFGLPGETKETIRNTINFAKRIPLDKAQFLLLDVLPGSELWDRLMKGQAIDWGYRSYQEATWAPEGLDKERLKAMLGYAFRTFFLRPRQIYLLFKYFKLSQIPFVVRRIIDFNILSFPTPRHKGK